EANAVGFFQTEERGNVRMMQSGEQARLALEARQPVGVVGAVVLDDLDGDLAIESGVAGAGDFAPAANAGRAEGFVVAEVSSLRQRHADLGQEPNGRKGSIS